MILLDLQNLEFIDKNLRDMVLETQEALGITFTITSLYRVDDPGVHGQIPLRGIDVRMRNDFMAFEVVAHVKSRWRYDPDRPHKECCIAHDTGQGFHLHFQTHPGTVRVT